MTFIELTAYHRGFPNSRLDPETRTTMLVNVDAIRSVQRATDGEMSFITFVGDTGASLNYLTVTESYEDIVQLLEVVHEMLAAIGKVPA